MNKKILFFDIDGTLVSFHNGQEKVLASTKYAIQKTREKGNLVYLCTGRSKSEIYDFIMDIGVDGVIGAGGGYVEINGSMLYHKKVSASAVRHLVDFFDQHGFDYYLESNGGLYGSKHLVSRIKKIVFGENTDTNQSSPFLDALILNQNMYRNDVNKVCFLEHERFSFETVKKEFEEEFSVIQGTVAAFGSESGELMVPNVNKANAIDALIQHLNITPANTYAFGDGLNDIEMFEYCQTSIAMGNAKEELKAIATYVTDSADEDGIYNSMERYHLI